VYYSCIFNFNLFHFMFLLFRRASYKVADVNFYVNKGLLPLSVCSMLLIAGEYLQLPVLAVERFVGRRKVIAASRLPQR